MKAKNLIGLILVIVYSESVQCTETKCYDDCLKNMKSSGEPVDKSSPECSFYPTNAPTKAYEECVGKCPSKHGCKVACYTGKGKLFKNKKYGYCVRNVSDLGKCSTSCRGQAMRNKLSNIGSDVKSWVLKNVPFTALIDEIINGEPD